MAVTVVTPASTTLLTTVGRVQAELGLTAGEDTDLLAGMIERASSAIARECRRVFGRETVTETLDGSGSRLLALSRTPIVSVASVTEDGVALAATEYAVEDAEAGALYRQDGWGRAGGYRMWGTEAFSSGYILPGSASTLRYAVTYTGGYLLPPEAGANLPGAVEQACLETVKAWYEARDGAAGEVSSLQIGTLRVGYRAEAAPAVNGVLPARALALLRNERRIA